MLGLPKAIFDCSGRISILISAMDWNQEIDALEFVVLGHELTCVIHRLAFRVLLKVSPPTISDCLRYSSHQRRAFDEAALSKAKRMALAPGTRFHITSRDVRKSLCLSPAKDAKKIASERTCKNP